MKKYYLIALILTLGFTGATKNLQALSSDEIIANLKAKMYSSGSMTGNISWSSSGGTAYQGSFKYLAPGKIYVKFTSPPGKTIVTNGDKLWIFDPASNICGIQTLGKGNSGGIAGIISGYQGSAIQQGGSGYLVKLTGGPGKHYQKITLFVDTNFMLKRVTFTKDPANEFTIVLSNVDTSVKLSPGFFEFNTPSSAQVVLNPLDVK